ncbi:MAG: hypothetical protein VCA55_13195 [Verrucomicrobiales bacterium]
MNYKNEPGALEREWLVLNCPHCTREVRIRSNARRSQLACPYCSNQLGKDTNPPETVQSSSSSTTPVADVRRARRGKEVQLPVWDKKQAEDQARKPDKDTTEFLEIDPNNENQIRIRRVRRKIHLTPWEKLRRILLFSLLAIIGTASMILLLSLVFKGSELVTTDMNAVDARLKQAAKFTPVAKSGDQIPISLTRSERDACLQIIRSFAAAKTLEEKLALVTHPEITGPRMEDSELSPGDESYSEVVNSNKVKIDNEKYVILLSVRIGNLQQQRFFAFIQSSENIKLDWEISFRYQPMPLEQFKSTRPTLAQPFRAKLRNGDFYANDYDDKTRWQCVEIYYPGDPDFLIYGYIDRNTVFGQGLITKLELTQNVIPGLPARKKHLSVITSLRFPENPAAHNQVEVVNIEKYGWF